MGISATLYDTPIISQKKIKKTGICLELSVIFRTFAADVPMEQLSTNN